MSNSTPLPRKIPDWKQKRDVLKIFFNVYSGREVFAYFLPPADVDAVYISSQKWHLNYPRTYMHVFDTLVEVLGCMEGVTGRTLAHASIDKFIGLLSEENRAKVKRAVTDGDLISEFAEVACDPDIAAAGHVDDDMIIHLRHTNELHSISWAVRAGLIDTSHYYSTAEAAETWNNLVSAEAYPTYDQCKEGLRRLITDSKWQAAVATASPTSVLMLGGGGAPTKDLVLLESVLERSGATTQPVTMILADISLYMLRQSARFLTRVKNTLNGHERIHFRFVHVDVYELEKLVESTNHSPKVFDRSGSALYAITGGTIGNLSERKFFQSLNGVAKAGDLLIVSADTVDDLPASELEARLTRKYNHAEMRRMIKPGVLAVLDQCHLEDNVDMAFERVAVRVQPSEVGLLSEVPHSWDVTLVLTANKREIILLNSTRYSKTALIDFAATFGWDLVCLVPSPLNSHFVQFAFRKK